MNWRERLQEIQADKFGLEGRAPDLLMIIALQNAEILERQSPLFVVQMSDKVTDAELERVKEALREWHRDRQPAVMGGGLEIHADT